MRLVFTMRLRSTASMLGLLLATVACGPPGVAAGSNSGDESDSSGSSTSTESGTDTPTESGPPPDTEGDESTTLPGFVPFDDIICDCSQCDVWFQDCPEGEKCVPYPSSGGTVPDAEKCVLVAGEKPPGEPCTIEDRVDAVDDCDQTGICWDRIDGEGVCRAFCSGTPDNPSCDDPGDVCLRGNPNAVVNVCVPACDPLLQDCGPNKGCYWAEDVFACVVTSTGVPAGEPCGFIEDCDAGLVCIDNDLVPDCIGAACCVPFCNLALGDADCGPVPGTACVPFFEEGQTPPQWEQLGVCVVPP